MATEIFREGMKPPVDDDMGSMTKYLKKDKSKKPQGNVPSIAKPQRAALLKSANQQNSNVFREGMTPPMDDDMGSAQPGQPGQPKKKFAKGGSVSSASGRADGIAQKGKTKGKIIAMSYGGKC
jgi:hypothetical protein